MEEVILLALSQYPMASAGLATLGGLFVVLELGIKATKSDDAWYKAIKHGYAGRLIDFAKGRFSATLGK